MNKQKAIKNLSAFGCDGFVYRIQGRKKWSYCTYDSPVARNIQELNKIYDSTQNGIDCYADEIEYYDHELHGGR